MAAPSTSSGATAAALLALLAILAIPVGAPAQTDFYNLDKDRPLRVEDAYAAKRYAFELKGSPLTMAQSRDRTLHYRPSLELTHGLLPGLEVSGGVALDVARPPAGATRRAGSGLELSSLLNLTTETRRLPALGVRLTGHVPLEGDHDATLEVRGLATRTLAGPVRAHVNAGWSPGQGASERWWTGLALDYVLPFRHTLLLAETWVAERPESTDESGRRVHSTAGVRFQTSPVLTLDGGLGRTWSGATGPDWSLTVGLTWEFALRALMPGRPR